MQPLHKKAGQEKRFRGGFGDGAHGGRVAQGKSYRKRSLQAGR